MRSCLYLIFVFNFSEKNKIEKETLKNKQTNKQTLFPLLIPRQMVQSTLFRLVPIPVSFFNQFFYHFVYFCPANGMQLIPIEKIFSNRDSIRKAREAFLIKKGRTLDSDGLNIRETPVGPGSKKGDCFRRLDPRHLKSWVPPSPKGFFLAFS